MAAVVRLKESPTLSPAISGPALIALLMKAPSMNEWSVALSQEVFAQGEVLLARA